jgi:hypothetical protein
MDHQKHYNKLIEISKAKNRIKLKKDDPNYIYFERHHIKPKSLDGNNDKDNLVLLTGREHFIAHKLLTYIYKDSSKIALAFHKMAFSKRGFYKISNRDYQYARELAGFAASGKNNPMYGKTLLGIWVDKFGEEAALIKFEKWKKNSLTPTGWKHSKETKEIIAKSHRGIPLSDEHKEKCRQGNIGKHNGIEFRKMIFKKCQYCGQIVNLGNFVRWHDKNCLMNPDAPKRKKIKCKWCDGEFDKTNYIRWHGENCLMKPDAKKRKKKIWPKTY